MMNTNLEKVGNLICEARAILEEILDDHQHLFGDHPGAIDEDQQDVLEGILDNLQAAEGQFDWNKDEWIE